MHDTQYVVPLNVFRSCLHHHTTIRPRSTSIGGTHAIDDNLLGTCGGGNDKAARTHAERIDTAPVNLSDEGVLCGRQELAPPLTGVVLYLVNQLRRMLQAHTNSYAFGLNLNLRFGQIAVDVAG